MSAVRTIGMVVSRLVMAMMTGRRGVRMSRQNTHVTEDRRERDKRQTCADERGSLPHRAQGTFDGPDCQRPWPSGSRVTWSACPLDCERSSASELGNGLSPSVTPSDSGVSLPWCSAFGVSSGDVPRRMRRRTSMGSLSLRSSLTALSHSNRWTCLHGGRRPPWRIAMSNSFARTPFTTSSATRRSSPRSEADSCSVDVLTAARAQPDAIAAAMRTVRLDATVLATAK